MNHNVIFLVLLFSLSGLLLPPTFSSTETNKQSILEDVVPLAHATSLKPIEKAYAYKISLMIKLAELEAELQDLRENRPQDLVFPNGSPLPGSLNVLVYTWEHDIEQLEIEIKNTKSKKKKICDAIDVWEHHGQDDRILNLVLTNTKGLDDIIDISQSAAMLYINLIGGIFDVLTGDAFDIEIFCEMLELAIKAAEAVEDEDAVSELEEIAEIAMAVKETQADIDDLKKKIKEYKDALEKAEKLLGANIDNQSSIPPWIKNNAEWWSQGLISDRDFATGLGFMVQSGIIQVDNVEIDANGSVALSDNLSIPKWIRTNAEWWASGAITDRDFKSGIQYMIKEEVISFEEKSLTPINVVPSLDPKTAQLVFETAKQNEVSMKYLQQIKNAEYGLIENSHNIAVKDYSQNRDQAAMNKMISLENAEELSKNDSLRANQIHKKAVQLVEEAKNTAIKSGINVFDLDKAVVTQQLELDTMDGNFKTISEINSAYKNALNSQRNAENLLQDAFLSEISNTSQFKKLTISEQNSISAEIRTLAYSDFRVLTFLCDTPSSSLGLPANFIVGLKIQYAFGDDDPCDEKIAWITDSELLYFIFLFANFGYDLFDYIENDDTILDDPFYDDFKRFLEKFQAANPRYYYTMGGNYFEKVELPDSVIPDLIPYNPFGSIVDPEIIEGNNELQSETKIEEKIDDPLTTENPDGSTTTIILGDDIYSVTTYPDGTIVIEHDDDRTTTIYPDGSTSTGTIPDDVTVTENEDGSTTTTLPDDTTVKRKPDGTVITTYPDGSTTTYDPSGGTITPATDPDVTINPDGSKTTLDPNDGTKTTIYDDGKRVRTNPGGSTTTTLPDGTIITTYPDGSESVRAPNGDTTTTVPDDVTVTDNPDGSETTTFPDGTTVTVYPDGTRSRTGTDGTTVTVYPDGDTTTTLPDGTKTTTLHDGGSYTDHPDGSETTTAKDGTSVTYHPDGSVTTTAKDGTSTTKHPDGSTTTSDPFGDSTTTYPDGSTITVHVDGSVTGTIPNDGKVTTNPDGSETTTYPNGTTITTYDDGTTIIDNPDGSGATLYDDGTTVIDNPDGTTIIKRPDGTTVTENLDGSETTTTPDGTSVTEYDNGATITEHPDGTKTTTFPDGTIIIDNPDGTTTETTSDGTIITTNPDGTSVIIYPDGTTITEHPDGTETTDYPEGTTIDSDGVRTTTFPDGTVITTFPDGTTFTDHPDGTSSSTDPDGTIITDHPDGTTITEHPDGTKTTINPDGSGVTIHPEGPTIIYHPDGSITTINPDGSIIHRDPDGNVIASEPTFTENPDGSFTITLIDGTTITTWADGSTTTTLPDGTIINRDPDGNVIPP
jgi:hypothetical protein